MKIKKKKRILGECCKLLQEMKFVCTINGFPTMTLTEKRLKPISMATQWLWGHSIRKFFLNVLRKIRRMVYPTKERINT